MVEVLTYIILLNAIEGESLRMRLGLWVGFCKIGLQISYICSGQGVQIIVSAS